MEFCDALKMADYWNIEPPLSYLTRIYWGFGKKEEEPGGKSFSGHAAPFHRMPKALQQMEIKHWLRLHPGKVEKDFYASLQEKRLERYSEQLKKARDKK